MRKIVPIALAALFAAGSLFTLTGSQADAQGAPPAPPVAGDQQPGMGPPGMRPGMGPGMARGGMHRPPMGWMHRLRQFALIYPAPDRNLSGADVQKIAEAFLLFNGNHTWKVTEVTEQPETVSFALATPDGTAIAHFAMDRHTGRPERLN